MAGIGEFYTLSQSDLQAAFESAKADQKDYLVTMGYSSAGTPMGKPGFGFLLDMIDFHQGALPVSVETMEDDFLNFMREHGGSRVEGVRNLTRDFDDAVMPEGNYERIEAACEKARARYDEEVHHARMDARPLWRKALGLQPK